MFARALSQVFRLLVGNNYKGFVVHNLKPHKSKQFRLGYQLGLDWVLGYTKGKVEFT
jgi:hypothetical protein